MALTLLMTSLILSTSSADIQQTVPTPPPFAWTSSTTTALTQTIDEGRYGTVTSVLILQDGETVYEHYFKGADSHTLHDTRSVTKTITGMALGLAIRDTALTLETRPARYFNELAPFDNPAPAKLTLTVEDLLTMSNPLECNDWTEFSRGNEERMYLVENWSAFFWDLPVRGYPAWATPPAQSPYGRSFSYCTAGVQILGETVGRATQTPFMTYVEDQLFTPLGITSFEWPINGQGQAHMGGGLRLRTQDLAKLGQLYLNNGRWQDHQILDESWIAASLTPHAAIPEAPQGWLYGYLWWLIPYDVAGETYYAAAMNGNGGNRVFILPDWNITVVFTNTDYNTSTMHQNAAAFFQNEIVAHLNTDPAQQP